MLDIQVSKNFVFKVQKGRSAFLLLGNTGQGKSTSFLNIVLELIRQDQPLLIFDPYGDLVKVVLELVVTEKFKNKISVFDENNFSEATFKKVINKNIVFVSGKKLTNGSLQTRNFAQEVLPLFFKYRTENTWILIDEAFQVLTKELYDFYLAQNSKLLLCDVSLIDLSETQRSAVLSKINHFLIYKIRNIDGKWLENFSNKFDQKSLKTIKQYHFQCFTAEKIYFLASKFPYEEV